MRRGEKALRTRDVVGLSIAGAIGVACLSAVWSWHWGRRAYAPDGSEALVWVDGVPEGCLMLAALLAVPAGCLALLVGRTRAAGVVALAASPTFLLATILLQGLLGPHPAEAALRRAANNLEPVVGAVEGYARDHGEEPKSLADLVPGYLADLPSTGVGAWPDYTYRPPSDTAPWSLTVWTPISLLDFSGLVYSSGESYPERWERVTSSHGREWAHHID